MRKLSLWLLSWLGQCPRARGRALELILHSAPQPSELSFTSEACIIPELETCWPKEQEDWILLSSLSQTHGVTSEKPFLPLGLCTQERDRFLPVGYDMGSALTSRLPGPLQSHCMCTAAATAFCITDLWIIPVRLKHFNGFHCPPIQSPTNASLISLAYNVLCERALSISPASFLSLPSSTLCATELSTGMMPTCFSSLPPLSFSSLHPFNFYSKTYAVNRFS